LKVVTLLSGGIDSSTLLYWLKRSGYKVKALTIIYGQKHSREIESAKIIAKRIDVDWTCVDLSALQPLLKSALTRTDVEIPSVPDQTAHYNTLQVTVVPNRNMILLSIAAAYAISNDFNAVAYAAHYSDRGVYPDCRWEFVHALEVALQLANDRPDFRVLAPFVRKTKADIVRLGHFLGVPYELTWSCYKGGERHCGKCSSCRERKRAFQEAGVPDPTAYDTC